MGTLRIVAKTILNSLTWHDARELLTGQSQSVSHMPALLSSVIAICGMQLSVVHEPLGDHRRRMNRHSPSCMYQLDEKW